MLLKRNEVVLYALILALLAVTSAYPVQSRGEVLFQRHCVACHANGGNSITPDKTLSRHDRERHGMKKPADIVKQMRNPGQGMTAFGKVTLSDKDAGVIAEYILKSYK